MQPFTDYQTATRMFREALAAPAETEACRAEIIRLMKDEQAKAASFAAAEPETAEDAARKLEQAADDMRHGPFADGEWLADTAAEFAAMLASGEPDPEAAAKLRRLLVYSEAGAAAFYDRHGGCSTDATANAIDHLRTALTGLSRPRLAA